VSCATDRLWIAAGPEPDPPGEPPPGPPELQQLMRRLHDQEPADSGEPSPAPPTPERDPRLLYTTTFLQLILIPAILFGPMLSYPSNALAMGSSGGLAVILAYLELQHRQKWFALISLVVGLMLLANSLAILSQEASG